MVEFINREPEFSPGDNIERDAAILKNVQQYVKADVNVVVHMCRSSRKLMELEGLERQGVRIINSPSAVYRVSKSREYTMQLLQAAGVPIPSFWAFDPELDEMFQCEPELQELLPGWVKCTRANGHSYDDVRRVETPLQADSAVIELSAMNVPDIIVQKHIDGELIKCYAVVDLRQTAQCSNADSYTCVSCWPSDYRELALRISRATRLEVFGFDVILSDAGPVVVDVNDFPSFSIVRNDAALAIANLITS